MSGKQRFNITLPDHIAEEIRQRCLALGSNPTEYAALIARKWYADGCPAVTPEESRLRETASPTKPTKKTAA